MSLRYLDLNAARIFAAPAPGPTTPHHEVHTVIVLGEPLLLDSTQYGPPGADRVIVDFSEGVRAQAGEGVVHSGQELSLSDAPSINVDGHGPSAQMDGDRFEFRYMGADGGALLVITLHLTFLRIALLCDADRDGKLDEQPARSGWAWGTTGRGPVLLVNNDRDVTHGGGPRRDRLDNRYGGPLDFEDMAPLAVAIEGPASLSSRYKLVLQVSDAAAEKIRIFDLSTPASAVLVEPGAPRAVLPYARGQRLLAAEGLQYPDYGFSGLVSVDLVLTEDDQPVSAARVVFRVAPWIMPSNLRKPRRVFMCEMDDESNQAALEHVGRIAAEAGAEFVVVPPATNRSDRWIQDEMEIGYSQAPQKTIGVVLDSPRDRALDAFPERLIAPDFGWVTRGDDGTPRNSLESFGNLEVSPPLTVGTRSYPLGRIIFGGAHPTTTGRRMMKMVSDFLYAQQVQAPVELYSDWLSVGHVDEFMSFVPTRDARGFRLLLASPALAWRLLTEAQQASHGGLFWLRDKLRADGSKADVTVDEVLANTALRDANLQYQRYIDWNRAVLMRELGLDAADIIDVPVLFQNERGRAGAYYPDVVNLLVLGDTLAIPKPFGPEPDGMCIFEREIRARLEPLGLKCEFVDTWYSYHILSGEIHCGTNAYREPLDTPWWETEPPTAQDV